MPKIEIDGVSIVLVGSFNPQIFQPAWFAAQSLISSQEAEDAKIEIVHADVAAYSLEWMSIEVLRDRFIASTIQTPSFDILRDLVIGTFSILNHTPISLLGLNSERHFKTDSEAEWHSIGRRLAPQEPWSKALKEPALRSLTMKGERLDGLRGALNVKVEPSAKIIPLGVYVHINDHYEIQATDSLLGSAASAVQIIRDGWAEFLARPDKVARAIFESSV